MWVIVCSDPASKALGYCASRQGWVRPSRDSRRLVFASYGLAWSWAWEHMPNGLWTVHRQYVGICEVTPF